MKKNTPFVLQGKYRRKSLPSLAPVKGHDNSTPRKVKEALFQMVENQISEYEHTLFYDLFAGSGQMGIEAISRGAFFTVFYEIDKTRFLQIRQWLGQNCENSKYQIKRLDAFRYLSRILQEAPATQEGEEKRQLIGTEELAAYDLVLFAAPPYRAREGEAIPPLLLLDAFFSTPDLLPVKKVVLYIQCPSEKSGIHRHYTSEKDKKRLKEYLQKEEVSVHDYGNHRIISAFREN